MAGGLVLAIKNVNIEYVSYSQSYDEDYSKTKSNLNKLKGTILLFVNDGDILSSVSGEGISVAEYKKVFPCTLNVTLKERVETFAVACDDGFDFYDADGKLMRNGTENLNAVDGSPNVLINSDNIKITDFAAICVYFKNSFGYLRSGVESVAADATGRNIIFNLYSGLLIEIDDFKSFIEQKIVCARENYLSLSESEKLGGRIVVALQGVGEESIGAQYTP
jgi:hypothetical protein